MSGFQKNTTGQKWRVFAFNETTNVPLTGDAANISANLRKDYGVAATTNDVNPTEIEDGYYEFTLLTAETNANVLDLYPQSSTANIQVIGVPGRVFTVPVSFADGVIQTGDTYVRVGATGSGLTSLAQASLVTAARMGALTDWINGGRLDLIIDSILSRLGLPTDFGSGTSTLAANLQDMADDGTAVFSRATDSLQALRDRGDAAWTTGAGGSDRLLLVDTTIATLASQTNFTLAAGSADDTAYDNCTIVVEDVATATQKSIGMVLSYTGATKTVTLKEALAFTIAATDKIYILAENSLKSTVANRQLDVTATGAAGIDWANVENPATAVALAATDIQLAATVTTNTDMRGTDGANTTAPDNASIAAILLDTAEIGAAGAGLTNVTINAASVQAVWDVLTSALVTVGSIGKRMADNLNATVSSRMAETSISTTGGAIDTVTAVSGSVGSVTGAVGSVTGNVSGSVGSLGVQAKLDVNIEADTALVDYAPNTTTPPTVAAIATAVLTTQMTESYAANGIAPTLAQAQFAMHQFAMQHGIAGTAWTVRKLDNTTTAFVVTLDSATTPTDAKRV